MYFRCTSEALLFHHFFKQSLITVHHIINHISVADRFEMLACAVGFGFLNHSELHGGHRALRLCDEIDMLDRAFIKGNRPVRIIVADRRCDIEAIRQFHIDGNIDIGIKVSRKITRVESYTIWSYRCRRAFMALVPSLPLIVGSVKISVS